MIEVRELEFSYGPDRKILESIAFDAKNGECIAVLGNNGAGKSTLIKCLNRILCPQRGVVLVDGSDISALKRRDIARKMAYVTQKNEGSRFTVFDAVLLGRKPYIKYDASEDDHNITRSVIGRMGLADFELRYLDELSGGELQKVMLARALAQQPQILMLDEPTSNLDLKNQFEVLSLVRNIAKAEKIAVIMVIHDINLALRYCDRFLFLKDRSVFAYGGVETVSAETIKSVYDIDIAIANTHGLRVIVPLPRRAQPEK